MIEEKIMNSYLEPTGFLGTGASLLADIALLAYILLIVPSMIIGYVFARQGKHRPQHQIAMTFVTAINWFFIIFLMLVAYNFDVVDNMATQPGNVRYLLPTLHGLLGLPAQVLATFIIVRMFIEDRAVAAAKRRGETKFNQYWWKQAKLIMQIAFGLWLATAALGILTYLIRYDVLPSSPQQGVSVLPVMTEAVDDPMQTEEAVPDGTGEVIVTERAPVVTEEVPPLETAESGSGTGLQFVIRTRVPVVVTEEAVMPLIPVVVTEEVIVSPPVATQEVAPPVVTEEADDDDNDGGQGRGRGQGGG